jgi:carbonic anhydrase/acetyltransferase-like protein (isoleucine patch superfamily)
VIRPFAGKAPQVPASAFVEASAQVVGDVALGEGASVWFNSVLRGDVGSIRIGARSNVQDLCVVHCSRGADDGTGHRDTTIGEDVTVGHSVTLHGCEVRDRVLVGMGATIMDGAVIEGDSMVAAGALVTPGKTFPPRTLISGAPAKAARPLTDAEVAFIAQSARNYVGYAAQHRAEANGSGGAI